MKYIIALIVLTFAFNVNASEEIEESIVVGAKIYNGYSDPIYDRNLLESIQYTKRYV